MILRAKYRGVCKKCKKSFSVGTIIEWTEKEGAIHARCSNKGRRKLRKWYKKRQNLTEAQHRENQLKKQAERRMYEQAHLEAKARLEKGIVPPPANWREMTVEERFKQDHGY